MRAPLTVGIVGCGEVTSEHVASWPAVPECQLLGFYDLDPDRARRFAAGAAPGTTVFGSLDELFARCDIVDLCTPPAGHLAQALAAIDAGRHVLVEKPVVMTLAEWRTLAARAEARDVKVAALHQLKLDPHFQRALRIFRAGRIGEVVSVSFDFLVDPEVDPPLHHGGWVAELPGGRWFEVLPHLLYLVYAFTGPLEPRAVTVSHRPDAPVAAPADDVLATLSGERCLASIQLSARSHVNERTLVVRGTEGTLEVSVVREVTVYTSMRRVRTWPRIDLVGIPFLEAAQRLTQWLPDRREHLRTRKEPPGHHRLMRGFARHLLGEAPPPTPFAEIESVTRCCEAIGEGIEAGLRAGGVESPRARAAARAAAAR